MELLTFEYLLAENNEIDFYSEFDDEPESEDTILDLMENDYFSAHPD